MKTSSASNAEKFNQDEEVLVKGTIVKNPLGD